MAVVAAAVAGLGTEVHCREESCFGTCHIEVNVSVGMAMTVVQF